MVCVGKDSASAKGVRPEMHSSTITPDALFTGPQGPQSEPSLLEAAPSQLVGPLNLFSMKPVGAERNQPRASGTKKAEMIATAGGVEKCAGEELEPVHHPESSSRLHIHLTSYVADLSSSRRLKSDSMFERSTSFPPMFPVPAKASMGTF